MATAHDIAAYIVEKIGPLSAMKLEKLVYYSQAWSLVWEDRPLFEDQIQAWINGPVVPALYDKHRTQFSVSGWPDGNPAALDTAAIETIDLVLESYAAHNVQSLNDMIRREAPWCRAQNGLDSDRGDREITQVSMMEYYSSLPS